MRASAGVGRARRTKRSLAIGLSVLASLAVAASAQATTYNVTRTYDPSATACATPAGGCSLRQTLVAVNTSPNPPDVRWAPAIWGGTSAAAAG